MTDTPDIDKLIDDGAILWITDDVKDEATAEAWKDQIKPHYKSFGNILNSIIEFSLT